MAELDEYEPSDDATDEDAETTEEDGSDEEDEDEAIDDEEALALRNKIEQALRVNGIEPASGDTDSEEEELMDDDQMMAIDEQLAEVFRSQTNEKKLGKRMFKTLVYLALVNLSHHQTTPSGKQLTSRTAFSIWLTPTSRSNPPTLSFFFSSLHLLSLSKARVRMSASFRIRPKAYFATA